MSVRSRAIITIVAAAACVALAGSTAHGDTTLHFDLPTAPLGIFGQQWSGDFISPVADIQGGVITSTRFHLEFDPTVSPNPWADPATFAIDFQPPVEGVPIFTLTGADLGWSGDGPLIGDFETDALNLPILDFPPDAEFALWFARIINLDDEMPLLGGQLTNSYIEVDVAMAPAPSAALLLIVGAFVPARRRRR